MSLFRSPLSFSRSLSLVLPPFFFLRSSGKRLTEEEKNTLMPHESLLFHLIWQIEKGGRLTSHSSWGFLLCGNHYKPICSSHLCCACQPYAVYVPSRSLTMPHAHTYTRVALSDKKTYETDFKSHWGRNELVRVAVEMASAWVKKTKRLLGRLL